MLLESLFYFLFPLAGFSSGTEITIRNVKPENEFSMRRNNQNIDNAVVVCLLVDWNLILFHIKKAIFCVFKSNERKWEKCAGKVFNRISNYSKNWSVGFFSYFSYQNWLKTEYGIDYGVFKTICLNRFWSNENNFSEISFYFQTK